MFRCCLPCRGGSTAPATSHPSSPESENYPNLYQSDSVHDDAGDRNHRPMADVSNASNTIIYLNETQPSGSAGLPHIEEEEESHHTSPEDDCNSLKEHLISTTHRSIRIVKLQQHQQHQQHQQQRQQAAQQKRNSAGGDSDRGGTTSATTADDSSPSPRSKHSRKQRNKSITSTSSNSESAGGGASGTGAGTSSALSTHLHSVTGGLLLPKMQAEQGSIGELQKYHSRYLKNRRHTLANVR